MDPDAHTFATLRDSFLVLDLDVFNPDMDMAVPGGANKELMQAHARSSALLLAIISKGAPLFKSQWCRAEIRAAMEAGVPVIPVYSADDVSLRDVKAVIDGRVDGLSRDAEHFSLVQYCFKEQIVEVVSTQHAAEASIRRKDIAARARAQAQRGRMGAAGEVPSTAEGSVLPIA